MKKSLILPVLAFLVAGFPLFIDAQEKLPLFMEDKPLKIEIEADLESIMSDRSDSSDVYKAILSYPLEKGNAAVKVKLEIRGNYRKRSKACAVPPLKIDFAQKKDPPPGVFSGQNKLKLVPQCYSAENVYREFMVYKVYNKLTQMSYRVRLVKIKFVDKKGNMRPIRQDGFLIESDREIINRLSLHEEVDSDSTTYLPHQLERDHLTLLHFFQAMIGNLDWDIKQAKNLKIFTQKDGGDPVAIPYDFDFSELVNAPYTGLEGFERMKFRPICRTDQEVENVIKKVLDKQDELVKMYKSSKYLNSEIKLECLSTFEKFYTLLEKEEEIKTYFTEGCEQ